MHALLAAFVLRGAGHGLRETVGNGAGYLEMGLVRSNTDRADLVAGDMAAAAQQRQDPARIRVLPASDVHAEPGHVLEPRAVTLLLGGAAGFGRVLGNILGLRHGGAVRADQRGGDVLGRTFGHQALRQRAVFLVEFLRAEHRGQQPFAVVGANLFGRGRADPFRLDLGTAQHRFDAPATRIGHHDDRRALLARAARAARTVLKRFGIARNLDMDD